MENVVLDTLLKKIPELKAEIGKKIIGQEAVLDQLLIAFIAGGHALLEGVPGLAKTLMIRTLAEALDSSFKRIQFTPDLMPSDIIGTEVLQADPETGARRFQFQKGPLFSNIILADEINRTPPKTQAALLEAMQEFSVTYAGKSYPLPSPFFILATQNPIEQAGTFPLPEAQMDRFLLYITIDYPAELEEQDILEATTGRQQVQIEKILSGAEILELQKLVREVHINKELIAYVNRLVRATRPQTTSLDYVKEWVQWGAGPRAGQAMILTAKAHALLKGRFAVTLEDLAAVIYPVLRHRTILNFRAEAEGLTVDQVTKAIWEKIEKPDSKL
jgi:MoxR-like ATPase